MRLVDSNPAAGLARSSAHQGALVVSLDFELCWGVRDFVPSGGAYEANLRGARVAVPRILELFEKYDVGATWATVGFLYGRSGDDLRQFRPRTLPDYRNARLDPYPEAIGASEESDPLHLAASLVDRIRATPRQEIATHTFSHFYCLEEGGTREAFVDDLKSALAIAQRSDDRIRSLVFPRNLVGHLEALRDLGIVAYRGHEPWFRFRTIPSKPMLLLVRAVRLLDHYSNLTGSNLTGWDELVDEHGLVNVRASRFWRPYSPAFRLAEGLRLRRIIGGVQEAARTRKIYHLWWHPHNFGVHLQENLSALERVLQVFQKCRTEHGMQSLTMAEVAEKAGVAVAAEDMPLSLAAGCSS